MSLAPLVERFARLTELTPEEERALAALPFTTQRVGRYHDVIDRGRTVSYLYGVVEGWAGRYNLRPDGSRRITSFLLPGDFCGIHAVCAAPMDHAIAALTDCTIARIEIADMGDLAASSPAINRALWRSKLIEGNILRIRLLNSNNAMRTVAHILCELDARLHPDADGETRDFAMPLTQEQLGDAIGITPVHVNRTLRKLRDEGLMEIGGHQLRIPDIAALRRAAHFDPAYLQSVGA